VNRIAPRLAAVLPPLTVLGLALAGVGPAPERADAFALLFVELCALVFVVAALDRAARSCAWLVGSLGAIAATLVVPVGLALGADTRAATGFDPARLDALASLSATEAWALLGASSLVAGLGLGLAARAERRSGSEAWLRAALVATATAPIGALVLWSSPGVDVVYSALRWSPLAFAMVAAVVAGAARSDDRAAASAFASLPVVAALCVTAAWAFIEVPMLDAASVSDLGAHRAMLADVASRDAAAFAWRLPLVPLIALLPLVALAPLSAHRRAAAFGVAAAAVVVCALPFAGAQVALNRAAEGAAFDPLGAALVVDGDETRSEVDARAAARGRRRVLFVRVDGDPAARVGPVVRAARAQHIDVVCVTPADDPRLAPLDAMAPRVARLLRAELHHELPTFVAERCADAHDPETCLPLRR